MFNGASERAIINYLPALVTHRLVSISNSSQIIIILIPHLLYDRQYIDQPFNLP